MHKKESFIRLLKGLCLGVSLFFSGAVWAGKGLSRDSLFVFIGGGLLALVLISEAVGKAEGKRIGEKEARKEYKAKLRDMVHPIDNEDEGEDSIASSPTSIFTNK